MQSQDQVERLLRLVPYLQDHPRADLADTAAFFKVSTKQLRTDLELMWLLELPGGMPVALIDLDLDALDSGTISISDTQEFDRPMRFTPDEATTLAVALKMVRELAGKDLKLAADSALAKLQSAAQAPDVEVVAAAGSELVRQQLADAIEGGIVVGLTYDGRTETTTPRVEPKRLAIRDGRGYLDAWNLDKDAWRIYRTERIAEVRPTSDPAQDRGKPPTVGAGWFDGLSGAAEVTLLLDESAKWFAEYVPVHASRRTSDGLEVTLLVADPAWLRAELLRLGVGVLEVDPPEAAASALDAARDTLGLYGL